MIKIRNLTLKGKGRPPTSRAAFKKDIKKLAYNHLGLRIQFVIRKKEGLSYCNVMKGKAVVCEGVRNKLHPLDILMELTLHEVAHWIQFNEGMFKEYFGTCYYGGIKKGTRTRKGINRLALRAERHADMLAAKMMKEFYGMKAPKASIYNNNKEAKEFLNNYYWMIK